MGSVASECSSNNCAKTGKTKTRLRPCRQRCRSIWKRPRPDPLQLDYRCAAGSVSTCGPGMRTVGGQTSSGAEYGWCCRATTQRPFIEIRISENFWTWCSRHGGWDRTKPSEYWTREKNCEWNLPRMLGVLRWWRSKSKPQWYVSAVEDTAQSSQDVEEFRQQERVEILLENSMNWPRHQKKNLTPSVCLRCVCCQRFVFEMVDVRLFVCLWSRLPWILPFSCARTFLARHTPVLL